MNFICNFREALNLYGWKVVEEKTPERLIEFKKVIADELQIPDIDSFVIMKNLPEFCKVNNAEFIPDLSRQVINDFLPK